MRNTRVLSCVRSLWAPPNPYMHAAAQPHPVCTIQLCLTNPLCPSNHPTQSCNMYHLLSTHTPIVLPHCRALSSVEDWLYGLTYYSLTWGWVTTESHWWVTLTIIESHIISLFIISAYTYYIWHTLISDTMIIHLHMVSCHIIIASYCTIVMP